ncbi:hypothetical protein HOU08_gp254 [Dickeya phage vB_DsoM_JA29]|uniref:Uncharacterized protein n=1 Tax=Dickeya phage vB_DsoM_JA29 TaxID=2283031 RepID=A0A384ZXJ4_9CAUD|nr:hypothetical protein HOU08_gp254 [Dickeya phage vB_DsoM_JA29]AXG66980.1 hypothetical protein JA29_254 [Dickeya phage vB_DsoM_JA29]
MNSKLALIAAICIEAFTTNETDNIATITIRALLHSANITITPTTITFESEDFSDDCVITAELSCADENIRIHSKVSDEFADDFESDDERTVVFAEATHALQFVCSQLAGLTLDPEFSIVPLEDSRISGMRTSGDSLSEDSEEDAYENMFDQIGGSDFLQTKRTSFLDKHFGSAAFIKMCSELEVPPFENKQAALAYFELKENDPELQESVVDTFEMYMELDTSSYAWDDYYDLMESIIEEIDKKLKAKSDRKCLLRRIGEWLS